MLNKCIIQCFLFDVTTRSPKKLKRVTIVLKVDLYCLLLARKNKCFNKNINFFLNFTKTATGFSEGQKEYKGIKMT